MENEKKILDLLLDMNERLIRLEEKINTIESSQTEGIKVTKKTNDLEMEYLNYRLTDMDKRLFQLEKRIEK